VTEPTHNGHNTKLYFISILTSGPELIFLVDLLKKTIVFLGIFFIAVGINLTLSNASEDVSRVITVTGKITEYVIFISDCIWFILYIVTSTIKEIRMLLEDAGIIQFFRKES
jgi:hypothetical protein